MIERARSAATRVRGLLRESVDALRGLRRRVPTRTSRFIAGPRPVPHADERTIRRIAEAQMGGVSSQESDARYQRGENPGGIHQKAPPPPEVQLDPEDPGARDAEMLAKEELDEQLQPGERDDYRARGTGGTRVGRRSPPYQRRGA